MEPKLIKDETGFATLEGRNLEIVKQRLLERFTEVLQGLKVQAEDRIQLTYALKITGDMEVLPVPFIVKDNGCLT